MVNPISKDVIALADAAYEKVHIIGNTLQSVGAPFGRSATRLSTTPAASLTPVR